MTRYLVIGVATAETVTHQETNRDRHDIGGVAGQTATALARNHQHVTLLTSTGEGPVAHHTLQMLQHAGINVRHIPAQRRPPITRITTRRGEQVSARGHWPTPSEDINRLLPDLIDQADCVALETNLPKTTAMLALRLANQAGIPIAMTATTRGTVPLIANTTAHGKFLIAMNEGEAKRLTQTSRDPAHHRIMEQARATNLLVTLGSKGWILHRDRQDSIVSPAPPVPRNSDYIGCGDYAAAGALHALRHDLPIADTVNAFISLRLQLNTR